MKEEEKKEKTETGKTKETSAVLKTPLPGRTMALIITLSIVTVVLLCLALYSKLPQTSKPLQTAKPQRILTTTLSISNPVASFSAYTSNIILTTQRSKITAADLELSFDPKLISNVDIKPGPYFTNPTILLKKIDAVNGKISYVLGIGLGQKTVNGNGTVALLSFTSTAKSGTITIDFQKDSMVTAAGVAESILTSTKGIEFFFGPTPTP